MSKNKNTSPIESNNTETSTATTVQTAKRPAQASDLIVYDNTTYHVPHADDTRHGITFLSIKTSREYLVISESGDYEPPYYEACDGNPVTIWFHTEDNTPASKPIFISLFKAGCSKAIVTCRAKHNDLFESQFNRRKSILPAGNYLLVISGINGTAHPGITSCGNHTIYPFHILSPHTDATAPSVTAHTATTSTPLVGSCRNITVELTFKADYTAYSRHHITCIDSNYRRVATTDCYLQPTPQGGTQTFDIKPDIFWSGNGRYTLIFSQNGTYTAAATLSLPGSPQLPADDTPDEKILRAIAQIELSEKIPFHWFNLYPGLTAIRKRIFAIYYKKMLYKELKENNIADYTTQASNIVVADDNYSRTQCANTIARLAGTLRGNNKEVDLASPDTGSSDGTWRENSSPFAFLEGENNTYIVRNLSAAFGASGGAIIDKMRQYLRKGEQIVLSGTHAEAKRLFELYPDIEPYFTPEYRFSIEPCDTDDTLYTIARLLKRRGSIRLGDSALTKLYTHLSESQANGTLPDFTIDELQTYAGQLEQALHQRLQNTPLAEIKAHPEAATTLTADDVDTRPLRRSDTITQCLAELRQMTGLHAMKETIESITRHIQWEQKCRRLGATGTPVTSPHMIFTGNPGTGKTTVAKMTGRIFRALGLLSKGEVIVAERSRLVGRYIGETERNMQELLRQARGNVLFIDEAYTLCDTTQDRKDFGYRVIESLLTALAAADSDMIVILAGYEEEMERLISSNIGLRGRFPHIIRFDDYTPDELMQIGHRFIQQKGCILSDEAAEALRQVIIEATASRDRYFSNARWIEQLITSHILPALAQRTLQEERAADLAYYRTIEAVDIAAIRPQLRITPPRPATYSIGFRA